MDDLPESRPLLELTNSPPPSPTLTSLSEATSTSGQIDARYFLEDDVKLDDVDSQYITFKVVRKPPPYVASLSPEERMKAEKALVRRLDLRLIPPVVAMYILNYIDRNAIASARLGGLEEDLNLRGSEYETAVSILFVGYILMQVPSNLLMNKLGKPSLYLPIAMMIWGFVSALTGAVHNFAGLVVVRFVLGFVESPFFPGALFLLSCFYTRKELALRIALLYSGSLVSGAFAGLLAAAVMEMDGLAGLRAWRWLFIIEGATTVIVAFSCIFILPDMPETTKWLTLEQRELASWRLDEDVGQDDRTSNKNQGFFHGLVLAVKDVKVWILMILLFCMGLSGAITNFFPSVVQTLGYGRIKSLLLTVPPYILGVITCTINAWHSDRTGEKYFHITLPLLAGVTSFVLAAATTSTAPRYVSMMLMIPGCYTGYVVALGWISSTIPRPSAKRAAALALINAVSNVASIFSSYMFPSSAAPRYVVAFTVCSCSSFIAACTASGLRTMLARLNKKLDRGETVQDVVGSGGEGVPDEAAQRGFRFLL